VKFGFIFILFISAFLFIGGPDSHDLNVYREFWQMGHFVLFAMIILFLMRIDLIKSKHWLLTFFGTGFLCFAVGLSIEVVQRYVGRTFSFDDVFNDMLGGYAGFFSAHLIATFSGSVDTKSTPKFKRLSYVTAIFILSIISGHTFIKSAINQLYVVADFPILSNLEKIFEEKRWKNYRVRTKISAQFARHGDKGMKVTFLLANYPSLHLLDFNSDWTEYKELHLSIFNTESTIVEVVLNIYDHQHHHTGYRFFDRYHNTLKLEPGWNDLAFPLEEIKNAPKTRQMDMDDIFSFSLFMIEPERPTTIYLDDIYLSR